MAGQIATRQSWKTLPPGDMAALPYQASFTLDEYARICRGIVPEDMEDKWFVFSEDQSLYFHRSWTGFCVFAVDFRRCDDHVEVAAARVAVRPERQGVGDEARESAFLDWLIRGLLLRQPVEFPREPPIPEVGRMAHRVLAAPNEPPLGTQNKAAPTSVLLRLKRWLGM